MIIFSSFNWEMITTSEFVQATVTVHYTQAWLNSHRWSNQQDDRKTYHSDDSQKEKSAIFFDIYLDVD